MRETTTGGPPVEAADVVAGYGRVHVLDGLALAVARGEVYALVGRNGEGKSTLIASLMGFRPVIRGRVRLFGADPWRERTRLMRSVGFLAETPDAPPDATLARLAHLSTRLFDTWDRPGFEARLRRFGIPLDRRFAALSRGQRGLASLALALGHAPSLLIFDDPTLGFDPIARATFEEEIVAELADRGATIFLTSHDLDAVERIADRVGILHRGRLVAEGPPDELRRGAGAISADDTARPSLEDLLRDLTTQRGAA
ncbi:MAG: ABC transporter ATP-binding protein [Thermoanaerobaculia bacterium]